MNTALDGSAEQLRTSMVDQIVANRPIAPRVEEAMRTVARHAFVPQVTVEDAYADIAVITHRFADGTSLSCASVPSLVAIMLDRLDVHPGDRVLEIGAGTGYNAALLAELVGPQGSVTTIDIDPDVTANARRNLDAQGYDRVTVITGDGALGSAENAPYDRIIVTVGAWDLPQSWWEHLNPGGRLVVPLRWRGQTQAVSLTKSDGQWTSDWVELCGFVPMLGQDGEKNTTIDAGEQVTLHWDADQDVDPDRLQGVLDKEKVVAWSTATVGAEDAFDGVWLHLTAVEPGTVRIQASDAAVASGLCTPAIAIRSPAIVEGDSLAYFTMRRVQTEGEAPHWQLGATGHGRAGSQLAYRLIDQIIVWNSDRMATPTVTAFPTSLHNHRHPHDREITKPNVALLVTY